MKTWFILSNKLEKINFEGKSDFRFAKEFAKKFIKEFTKKGDKVLDPFAGFGTTLFAAQQLGRIGVGIEYDKDRYSYIQQILRPPSLIIHGDSLKLKNYKLPKCDFSLTSPP